MFLDKGCSASPSTNYKQVTKAKILCQIPPCQPAKSYKLLADPMGLAYIGTSLPPTVSKVGAACKVLPHWSRKTITHCLSLFPIVSQLGYRTNWLLGLGANS